MRAIRRRIVWQAVKFFVNLWARGTQAEHKTTVRQRIEARGCHRQERRSTAVDVHDAGSNRDALCTGHQATMLAIKRALANQPSVDELIANRHKIKHDMHDWR